MDAAYFVRVGPGSSAVIKLLPNDREEVIVDGLSQEVAIERCFALLEELPRGATAVGETSVAEDIAPRRRPRQLALKV